MQRLPVLGVLRDDLTARALVVGDPKRAEQAARLLESPRQIGSNREYLTFSGKYQGQPVVVCSHGVGSAGASVCFHELIEGEVQVILRAGTCGALQAEIDEGSLIIATAAVREDGTTDQLIPMPYPAVSAPELVSALQQSALQAAVNPIYTGIILTQAHLYPGLLPTTLALWQRAGVLGVEMELAALLVLAGPKGRRAGGIFTTDGNLARQGKDLDPETYNPNRLVVAQGVERMLQISLSALAASMV
jgi:uridine phosphorylase